MIVDLIMVVMYMVAGSILCRIAYRDGVRDGKAIERMRTGIEQ